MYYKSLKCHSILYSYPLVTLVWLQNHTHTHTHARTEQVQFCRKAMALTAMTCREACV
jgi:hypothetical protein